MTISRLTAVVTLVVGLALAGCGSDGDGAGLPGGPGVGAADDGDFAEGTGPVGMAPGGPAQPNEVFTELAHRLADGDSERVCALFTDAGKAAFATVYESSTCVGAADVASARIEDEEEVRGWNFEGRGLEVSGDTAVLSETCRDSQPSGDEWGSVTIRKTDAGWVITGMEPASTFSSCGG